MATLYGHTDSVNMANFTNDGKSVVSISSDSSLRCWNVLNGKEKCVTKGRNFHTGEILSLSLHDSRSLALTGGNDNIYCLSNYEDGNVYNYSKVFEGSVEGTCFSKMLIYKK